MRSPSEIDITTLDSDLTTMVKTNARRDDFQEEKNLLRRIEETAQRFRDYYSHAAKDGVSALGHNVTNVTQKTQDNLKLMLQKASNFLTSTPPIMNFSFSDISFATSNIIGTSLLEKDFRTSTQFVSAEQAQAVQEHIAEVENANADGISTIANQEFAALVLAPQILEAKQEQLLTGNRQAFTEASSRVILETHDGVLKMEDGTYAVSQDKLEEIKRDGLSGKFDAAGDDTQTPDNVPVTTYEYSDNTAAFNAPASGADAKPTAPTLDITNPEFDILTPA